MPLGRAKEAQGVGARSERSVEPYEALRSPWGLVLDTVRGDLTARRTVWGKTMPFAGLWRVNCPGIAGGYLV
jgi:hypothetical protein